ncbi:HNH endonuclease signature motif containing protein [Streptomyces sp. NPDC051555]|uniref:HNH endonuclease signature motif containing protein n=1 Tax=Streptomyces sp. NPDC051555 TaxID=3365657 RepID=UPI0037B155C0
MTCSMTGCSESTTEPRGKRGMCKRHYERWNRWRKSLGIPSLRDASASERFWAKVRGTDVSACWEWGLQRDRDGYGKFSIAGKTVLAHRYAYEHMVTEIPEELQLDHLCRSRSCVNPWHLEPVTGSINVRRQHLGESGTHPETHCRAGHPRSTENTYVRNGQRTCRPCNRESKRRSKERAKPTKGATR